MQKGKKPVIYGNGEQTRDYIYIKDVVRAAVLAMESKTTGIFNVGTGKRITTNEVVEILNRMLGTSIEPKRIDNPIKNYVFHTQADCSKTEKVLGFKPEYFIESGITEVISKKD